MNELKRDKICSVQETVKDQIKQFNLRVTGINTEINDLNDQLERYHEELDVKKRMKEHEEFLRKIDEVKDNES